MEVKDRMAAAEEILTTQYEKLYRLAYTYVQNQEDALDGVLESACKVIRDWGYVRQAEHLSTWICRVVINTSLDVLRRRKKEMPAFEMPDIPAEENYGETELKHVLGQLDEKSRTVIVLRYFEDMKLDEIAEILGENTNTVKARLYRALKKLRSYLTEETPLTSIH